LVVKDERGNRLVFRYYDPRVLRVYLPTCSPSELRTVFGPIECFWAEGPKSGEVNECCLASVGLSRSTLHQVGRDGSV